MFLKKMNGYVLAIVTGLILLAGVLLLALQWGKTGSFSLYGKNIGGVNMGLILACAAVAGWLTPKIFRVFLRGVGKIRKARKEYKKL